MGKITVRWKSMKVDAREKEVQFSQEDRRLVLGLLEGKKEGKKRKPKGKERASSLYSPPSLSPETCRLGRHLIPSLSGHRHFSPLHKQSPKRRSTSPKEIHVRKERKYKENSGPCSPPHNTSHLATPGATRKHQASLGETRKPQVSPCATPKR